MTLYTEDGRPAKPQQIREEAIAAYAPRQGERLTSTWSTRNWLTTYFLGYEREVFLVLYLNNNHEMINFEEMFYGTVDGAAVYPREIVKHALYVNAKAVILAHNHPSGTPTPSRADQRLTDRIRESLELIDVRMLDHFVVADGEAISFAERGMI